MSTTNDNNHEDPPPPPMTDDDYNRIVKQLGGMKSNDMVEICNGFVQQIKGLLSTVKKTLHPVNDEDELVEVERVIRIVNMLPADEIFIRSKDKIWYSRKHILSKNIQLFLKKDISKNIKRDSKQVMIETLVKLIKYKFQTLSTAEQEMYWAKLIKLLQYVAKFKQLVGEVD